MKYRRNRSKYNSIRNCSIQKSKNVKQKGAKRSKTMIGICRISFSSISKKLRKEKIYKKYFNRRNRMKGIKIQEEILIKREKWVLIFLQSVPPY
jgi:hypothetical protein